VAREDGQTIEEVALQAESLEIVEKPNGPAAAALLAAGIGTFVLGLFTTWAEASDSFAQDTLKIDNDVGPLSGKTTFAVIAYLIAWAVLTPVLWKRSLPWPAVLAISGALIAAGYIGTFPKFFELFAPD
jgi:fluoride ion exporter CrcB/FEX